MLTRTARIVCLGLASIALGCGGASSSPDEESVATTESALCLPGTCGQPEETLRATPFTLNAGAKSKVGVDSNGRLNYFSAENRGVAQNGITPVGPVWVLAQTQAADAGSWGVWKQLGGSFVRIVGVANNEDGRLQIFAMDQKMDLWTNAQAQSGSATWNGWRRIGTTGSWADIAIANDKNGRMTIVFPDTGASSGYMLYAVQAQPGDWTFGAPMRVPGGKVATDDGTFALARSAAGLRFFFLDATSHIPNYLVQSADGSWLNSVALGSTPVDALRVIANTDGRLEIVANSGAQITDQWEYSAGSDWWSGSVSLDDGQSETCGQPLRGPTTLARNADGRLEAFAHGVTGTACASAIMSTVQGSFGHWTPRIDTGGINGVVVPSSGKMHVFFTRAGSSPAQVHFWQGTPGVW